MAYYFILPGFLLSLLVQIVLLGATFSIQALRPARVFVWRILVGSTAGFLAAHAYLLGATVLPFGAYNAAGFDQESWICDVLGWQAAFGLIVGPVLATVLGFGLGAAAGIRSAMRSDSPACVPIGTSAPAASPGMSGVNI